MGGASVGMVCWMTGSGWAMCRHGHVRITGSGWGHCRHGVLDDRSGLGLFVCMYHHTNSGQTILLGPLY